jgi:hypothetical protein
MKTQQHFGGGTRTSNNNNNNKQQQQQQQQQQHAPMRPIFSPERARARRADWAPGPGDLDFVPPVPRILMCSAVMFNSLQRSATSWAASIAAYGDDSSRSAFTFMPPEDTTATHVGVRNASKKASKPTQRRNHCDTEAYQ